VPHSFPPLEALEFEPSLILVPLLCGLKNHDIIGSALSGERFLIVNLIETRTPTCCMDTNDFWILRSLLMMRISDAVIGVSYGTLELHYRLDIAFNAIHKMHQSSMNLKTYFVSIK
jgi:hypothetical protein